MGEKLLCTNSKGGGLKHLHLQIFNNRLQLGGVLWNIILRLEYQVCSGCLSIDLWHDGIASGQDGFHLSAKKGKVTKKKCIIYSTLHPLVSLVHFRITHFRTALFVFKMLPRFAITYSHLSFLFFPFHLVLTSDLLLHTVSSLVARTSIFLPGLVLFISLFSAIVYSISNILFILKHIQCWNCIKDKHKDKSSGGNCSISTYCSVVMGTFGIRWVGG